MFGSRVVAPIIASELASLADVTSAVGDRITALMALPQDMPLPAILFYQEFSSYGDTIGGPVNYEGMRWTIRLICKGESDEPILAAAQAQFDHFHNESFDAVIDGVAHNIRFRAQSEVPLNTLMDGTDYYRQLGTVYDVEITRGA